MVSQAVAQQQPFGSGIKGGPDFRKVVKIQRRRIQQLFDSQNMNRHEMQHPPPVLFPLARYVPFVRRFRLRLGLLLSRSIPHNTWSCVPMVHGLPVGSKLVLAYNSKTLTPYCKCVYASLAFVLASGQLPVRAYSQ